MTDVLEVDVRVKAYMLYVYVAVKLHRRMSPRVCSSRLLLLILLVRYLQEVLFTPWMLTCPSVNLTYLLFSFGSNDLLITDVFYYVYM